MLGLVFWWMHERRRRQVERANRESLRWMAQALHDPLTGIGNRTALHDDVMADRGRALGLILIDIDFFKQYNDALGHPDGDRLLRELAGLIDTALGRRARLYRMGGDEFAALLPCDDEATLAEACRRLVAEVQRAALPHPGHAVGTQVTLSVGATHFKAAPDTFAAAYASADQALYHVKAHGRDGWRLCRLAACPG